MSAHCFRMARRLSGDRGKLGARLKISDDPPTSGD